MFGLHQNYSQSSTQLAEKTFDQFFLAIHYQACKVWGMALQEFTQGPVQDCICNSDIMNHGVHKQTV